MPSMFIRQIINRIKGEKKKEKVKTEIEELKKALLEDPEFRDAILRELEYRTGRRDILKAGVLGLLGLAVGGAAGAGAATVGNNTAIETISDYTGIKIPKSCTCIVAQDGTGDYDVLPKEDASEVIQRVIDDTAKRGGGSVLIREGEYSIYNTIMPKSNIVLEGNGYSTIFKIREPNIRALWVKQQDNIIIEKIAVDGNNKIITQPHIAPIEIRESSNIIIQNCYIANVSYRGINVQYDCNEIKILNNYIKNSQLDGIFVMGSNISVAYNTIDHALDAAIDVGGYPPAGFTSKWVKIIGNRIHNTSVGIIVCLLYTSPSPRDRG